MSWGPRSVRVFDGIPYVPGALYEVRSPCRLSGWTPVQGGHQGWGLRLEPGHLLTCRGYGPGWGSDPGFGIEWTCEEARAVHASACELSPSVGGAFAYRPAIGLVAVLENSECPQCHSSINAHKLDCSYREVLVP